MTAGLLLFVSIVNGDEPTPRERMTMSALSLYAEQDSFAAIDHLARQQDPLAATQALGDVSNHLYWQQKDLSGAVAFGRAGVQHGLTFAARVEAKEADELRSAAKAICYNLASFTWPGWDEKGITITASDLAVGIDAAKTNLRLALELKKGDLPLSRAYWMLGAHQLAARDFASALTSFRSAAESAKTAGAASELLLANGFAALTAKLQSPTDVPNNPSLDSIKEQLRELKDGEFFAGQIETAERVFGE